MANHNETIEIDSINGTDADHRRKFAIALAKQIQYKAENLAKYLQANEREHQQKRLCHEQKLEEEQVKALKKEIANKNAQLNDVLNKEMQIRRIAKKYKDRSYDLQAEVQALKNELTKKNFQLAEAANKQIQIRRVAKKYKDSFYEMKSKMELPEHNLNDAKLSVESENVQYFPNDNFVSFFDLKNEYEKNLLEENQARIAALTASDPLTNVQQFEVVDVVKRWKELDAKMQQIIDLNSIRASDVVPDNGRKRLRDSDDGDSTSNTLPG